MHTILFTVCLKNSFYTTSYLIWFIMVKINLSMIKYFLKYAYAQKRRVYLKAVSYMISNVNCLRKFTARLLLIYFIINCFTVEVDSRLLTVTM